MRKNNRSDIFYKNISSVQLSDFLNETFRSANHTVTEDASHESAQDSKCCNSYSDTYFIYPQRPLPDSCDARLEVFRNEFPGIYKDIRVGKEIVIGRDE